MIPVNKVRKCSSHHRCQLHSFSTSNLHPQYILSPTLNPATFSCCNDTHFFLYCSERFKIPHPIPEILMLLPAAALLPLSRLQEGGRDSERRERASERARVCCLWISQDVKCLLTNLLRAFASCAVLPRFRNRGNDRLAPAPSTHDS